MRLEAWIEGMEKGKLRRGREHRGAVAAEASWEFSTSFRSTETITLISSLMTM